MNKVIALHRKKLDHIAKAILLNANSTTMFILEQLLPKSVRSFVHNIFLVGSPGAGKTLLALAREVGAREFIAAKLLLLDYVFELQARPEKSYAKNGEAILTIRDSDNQYLKCGPLQILADRIGRRKPEIGASLIGTISSWRKLKNEPLDLVTKSFNDRAELYLHKTLGKVDFAAAFSDGQKMSIDEALDLALRAVTEM